MFRRKMTNELAGKTLFPKGDGLLLSLPTWAGITRWKYEEFFPSRGIVPNAISEAKGVRSLQQIVRSFGSP